MDPKDEMRSAIIQEFAPRKIEESKVKSVESKVLSSSSNVSETRKPISLGIDALQQVMEKRTEQEEISREEKDQARKPILKEANIGLMKDMLEYLR